ncbi:MAG TPA: uracil-DNA glycosylase [Candidatus Limnocylindria bacterium]|nr:uracil-DNA glycosylase [Candidatus Limnocylindria bacterium]
MGTAGGTSGTLAGAAPGSGSAATLRALAEQIRSCPRCPLSRSRTTAVPGEGNPLTDVLFVGEGPGGREDATGRPFVGPAGQLLNELLGSIGWERGDVFITNVVKCRPPGNRDPEPGEIGACRDYLDRQERAIDPAVVVTLGRHSLARYLPGARIGQVHGQLRRAGGGRFVFPMYHPAAALHQASLRETLFRDIRGLPAALLAARQALEEERQAAASAEEERLREVARAAGQAGRDAGESQPEQMTLF